MKETEMIDYKKKTKRMDNIPNWNIALKMIDYKKKTKSEIIAELIAIEKDNGYLPDHLLREYLESNL